MLTNPNPNVQMNTNQPVSVYISAASDLMPEREAVARMIAGLPVTLAWRIVQTPLGAEQLDLEALQTAALYLLVMGADIRAPVGLEWYTAQRAGRAVNAFLKHGVARTPAGQVFVSQAHVAWQPFSNAANLSRQVQRLLAEHLMLHALRYALTPVELENLSALQLAEKETQQSIEGEGAGRSAVILSRERFTPSEGVVVDE